MKFRQQFGRKFAVKATKMLAGIKFKLNESHRFKQVTFSKIEKGDGHVKRAFLTFFLYIVVVLIGKISSISAQTEIEVVPVLCGESSNPQASAKGEVYVTKACLNRLNGSQLQTLSFQYSDKSSETFFIGQAKMDKEGTALLLHSYSEGPKQQSDGRETVKVSEFKIRIPGAGNGTLEGQASRGPQFAIDLKKMIE